MNRRLLIAAVLAAGLLGAAAQAQTAEVAGVKFEPTIQLDGTPLLLNGYGVRYKAIFKVYAAALYLPAKAEAADAVIAAPGPKRVQMVLLRQLDANEFGKIMSAGIERNASREEFVQSLPAILGMGEAAARLRVLMPGDVITIDWVPSIGTTVYVKGKPEVGPIKDQRFFSALLKIWLGRSPVDPLLKDALLGHVGPPLGNMTN
ncbi:MAG TPA: chalcone isomerase family protein [Burkholderiaceae bacterium]|nr:chalcone isomerase family protein [Burkholderiaceae bacterium]